MTAKCSGSLDVYNGAAEICWLNGMQHSINYGLKFVFVFQYSCGRFFSEKKKKGKKMCREIRKTLSVLALLEADWSSAGVLRMTGGGGMILTWRVISLRLFLFRATPVSYHRHLAHQSDRSLPLLFKIAPVSCLASAWSTSCSVAPEPGSTWGQEVREFPSSFTVESTWNPGCVRKTREGVVDRRWQMWLLLRPQVRLDSWTGPEGDKTSRT